jgi:hypothetical protein
VGGAGPEGRGSSAQARAFHAAFGHFGQVQPLPRLLLQAGVDPGDLPQAGQERFQAGHLLLDYAQEASALCGPSGRDKLRGGADRGQGILQFVRQVCGERLAEGQLRLQAAGELPKGAGQLADLVAASGEPEVAAQAAAPVQDLAGLAAQAGQGPDDCGAGHQTQGHGRADGHQEDLEDPQAQLVQVAQDAIGGLGN